jgi:uncharacterized membrane protein
VAALAYVLLPVSGAFAFTLARSERVRFHGLQAIVYGVVWPALLYLGSLLSGGITVVVAAVGGLVWLVLVVTAAVGVDLRLPGLQRLFDASRDED